MKKDRKRIEINDKTKGRLVYVIHVVTDTHWIVLIDRILEGHNIIMSHMTIDLTRSNIIINIKPFIPHTFSSINACIFFEPNESDKKFFHEVVKSRGIKYVKAINKLIWR